MAEQLPEDVQEKRQSIDAVGFAILCLLNDEENSAKGLRELLVQFTRLELSRSPMYRRMRELVKDGYIVEEVRGNNENNLFSLTKKGSDLAIGWAYTFQLLSALALYTLEYTKTEEYANETK